nr:putative reverse transcriptase domain-containing protein [Tanacetum cinerariifolium]
DNVVRADAASDCGGEGVNTTDVVKDDGEEKGDKGDDAAAAKDSQPLEFCGCPRDHAPILALPEGSKDFVVYCDASIRVFGAVLMHREKVRVRALVMTVHTDFSERILKAQTEAIEKENVKAENLGRLLCEGRESRKIPEADIRDSLRWDMIL